MFSRSSCKPCWKMRLQRGESQGFAFARQGTWGQAGVGAFATGKGCQGEPVRVPWPWWGSGSLPVLPLLDLSTIVAAGWYMTSHHRHWHSPNTEPGVPWDMAHLPGWGGWIQHPSLDPAPFSGSAYPSSG